MRRVIAIILFVVIVLPAMCIFQIFAGINSFAFDSNFYTTFIDSPLLYQSLADGIGVDPQLAIEMPDGPIRDTLLSTTNPESLRQTAMTIAGDAVDAIINGRGSIPVTTDISSWREFIVDSPTDIQEDFLRSIVISAPTCGRNQTMMREGYPLPVCVPSEASREQLADDVVDNRAAIIEEFPSSITYDLQLDLGGGEVAILQVREAFSGTMTTSGIIAIGMWFLTAFVFANKMAGRFRWLGLTLLIPSAMMVIASVLFSQSILSILGQATTAVGTVDAEIANTVGNGLSRIGWSFFYAGIIPAVIGGLLLAYGSYANVRSGVQRGRELGGKVKNVPTDGITNIANSVKETSAKTKESLNTAGSKAKDNINSIMQSDNAQKAKDNITSASSKAKDNINSIMQSDNAQKAKDRFNSLAKGLNRKPEANARNDQQSIDETPVGDENNDEYFPDDSFFEDDSE